MKKYQQGDVILKEVDYEIEGQELNHLILAEGEATGHSHQLINGIGKLIMMDKILHLKIFSDTALLKHEEHAPIELKKGNYVIHRVNEYDHFLEESRQVRD